MTILLNRDVKKHENLLDELQFKKKAWEDELQRSLTKYRTKMDLNSIPEVLSSTGTNFMRRSQAVEGPFKRTPLFGAKRQSEDLHRFEWPSAADLRDMSLDQSSEYRVYKITHKESFGCLKAISMSMTQNLETPIFEKGRPDRTPLNEEFLDVGKAVNLIRVRMFQEKGLHFITGI